MGPAAGLPDDRARVYALHPHPEQTPGSDKSMVGEIKAPHFDIAHAVDIKPGRQGTFPSVDWNRHIKGYSLPGAQDANHPTDLAIQYGHEHAIHDREGETSVVAHVQAAARQEHVDRKIERTAAVGTPRPSRGGPDHEDTPLPGISVNRDGTNFIHPKRAR